MDGPLADLATERRGALLEGLARHQALLPLLAAALLEPSLLRGLRALRAV